MFRLRHLGLIDVRGAANDISPADSYCNFFCEFLAVRSTPGVRSFGLAHVDLNRVIHAFPDLADGIGDCPRGCTHDEPECALDAWVAAGHSDPVRLASFRRLLRSRDVEDDTG